MASLKELTVIVESLLVLLKAFVKLMKYIFRQLDKLLFPPDEFDDDYRKYDGQK